MSKRLQNIVEALSLVLKGLKEPIAKTLYCVIVAEAKQAKEHASENLTKEELIKKYCTPKNSQQAIKMYLYFTDKQLQFLDDTIKNYHILSNTGKNVQKVSKEFKNSMNAFGAIAMKKVDLENMEEMNTL